MIFVLVHGINDTRVKFKAMQAVLENQGHRCIVPSLTPKNGSSGLAYLARQLNGIICAEIDGSKAKICLVGFSMGGLVARYYLQELDGCKYVSQFFSIATPHHGSVLAYLSSNLGGKDMRPGSGFLRMLAQSEMRLQGVDSYSYWTPFDLMILPATSSIWAKAVNIKVNALCHPLMVKNGRIIADMLAKVEIAESAGLGDNRL
ncbi:MAG: hypothetical protein PHH59_13645 [Methylovulum sp.]|uniref:esterase/lipase family protein n=1 Tax=Methylovulum sp. TaxID=1916980 RepID=UPI00262841EE|nr:alpha/beta fold hydrolase [Methylovulum sp.]MDD2725050.1 hypothetical protein [Methylovulum sp.]MDD5125794.1 hypothetical protein [Methylovulum sp.]